MYTIEYTQFELKHQTGFYRGKVRDVYYIGNEHILMVATDRISAFDVILPRPIPKKGAILTQLAKFSLNNTKEIVPNWLLANPHPQVSFGLKCEPILIEMVVRGYLAGHAWRLYKDGKREICGVTLADGLREYEKLATPIITPTTKAAQGHDLDISLQEILQQKLVHPKLLDEMCLKSIELYEKGNEIAAKNGLILMDTKYEFGIYKNQLMLMDEIHTPDSSRFIYADGYEERLQKGEKQKQLSKEFVREWLIEQQFMGRPNDKLPIFSDELVLNITDRYQTLFEQITGSKLLNDATELNQNLLNNFLDAYFK